MKKILSLFALTSLMATGCSEGTDSEAQEEFRAGYGSGADPVEDHIYIYIDRSASGEICPDAELDWDVNLVTASDPDGNVILNFDDRGIHKANGTRVCDFVENAVDGTTSLRDSRSGEVYFTSWRSWIIDGDVDLGGMNPWQNFWILQDRLLYTYSGSQMYAGFACWGDQMAHASDCLQGQSDARKLVVAALGEGVCGGPGWPEGPSNPTPQ